MAVGAYAGAALYYDYDEIEKHVDWIGLMTYDFHGAFNVNTGLRPYSRRLRAWRQLLVNARCSFMPARSRVRWPQAMRWRRCVKTTTAQRRIWDPNDLVMGLATYGEAGRA